MSHTFPSVFVSHGSPSIVLEDCPTRDFLKSLGGELGRPKAIVSVSAHWTTDTPRLTGHPHPPTIHDFGGFPEKLYQLRYPAPGAPALAGSVLSLLREAGIPGEIDPERGLDHGAWAPLMLIYPDADIPVVQLSVQPRLGAHHPLEMGEALRPLRDEGILILASGSATHNLGDFFGRALDAGPLPYAKEFADWLKEAVVEGRANDLVDYERLAPHARRNHPTPEHFLPLLVAMGAGGSGTVLHDGYTYGALSMAAFKWE
ncbi:DODA-type extradiol aromatic ring-opening family dioxygenase [Geomonas ferrireducens]|uniref:DODA-type extradiol aromatic ring-opening family dioxygenase n=1 Tax=Geomonas ferrireducens TaxID=2570227 RepID=UPI0010A896B9|nr:class III extradiol ring-cleavage dioxygenase [Geomonas ferrireducens]